MQYTLGGDRGHPFAQHCSCPAILRCSVGLTIAAFLGTIFVWEKWLPQSHRAGETPPLRSIGKAATSLLPPLTALSLSSKMNMALTSVALVARPCAPDAQRPRLFQLQKQTCQKLWPLRALGFEARLLLPSFSSKGNIPRTVRLRRTS